MAFSNRSPVAGIVGAVPLTLAILCNFAVMGFLGIKLTLNMLITAFVSLTVIPALLMVIKPKFIY
jgi:predicted RND superfamily exporter protein